jgi:hypothetical protein
MYHGFPDVFAIRNSWRKIDARVRRTIRAKLRSIVPVRRPTLKNHNGHWEVWVTREKAALISEMLKACHVVIQNHGPGRVLLRAEGGDWMNLVPGHLRATYVCGTLVVEAVHDTPALIEVEFLPLLSRR